MTEPWWWEGFHVVEPGESLDAVGTRRPAQVSVKLKEVCLDARATDQKRNAIEAEPHSDCGFQGVKGRTGRGSPGELRGSKRTCLSETHA